MGEQLEPMEASRHLAMVDTRHRALVKMLGTAIARGDFTATEVLGALPLAQQHAQEIKLDRARREPPPPLEIRSQEAKERGRRAT